MIAAKLKAYQDLSDEEGKEQKDRRNNSSKKRTTTERKDTNLQEGESKGEKSKTREEITQVLSRKAEIPEILWEEHPSHNS